jgi:hypothetical protein
VRRTRGEALLRAQQSTHNVRLSLALRVCATALLPRQHCRLKLHQLRCCFRVTRLFVNRWCVLHSLNCALNVAVMSLDRNCTISPAGGGETSATA